MSLPSYVNRLFLFRNNAIVYGARRKYASTYALENRDAGKLTPREATMRQTFWEREKYWEEQIRPGNLSPSDLQIVEAHRKAVSNGHFTYDDPETRRRVMTRLRHFLRESCCGNACRHCPYNHDNVPAERKGQKVFNSAFWVEKAAQEREEETDDEDERSKPYFV